MWCSFLHYHWNCWDSSLNLEWGGINPDSTLHTTHYTLHTSLCTLHTSLCTLYSAHFTLHTTWYSLHTTYCTLQTAHYKHSHYTIEHYTLYTVHYTIPLSRLHCGHWKALTQFHTGRFTMNNAQFTLHTAHQTQHFYALNTVHSTFAHKTQYTALLNTKHSALHTRTLGSAGLL